MAATKRYRRRGRAAGVIAPAVALLLVLIGTFGTDRLILHPTTDPRVAGRAVRHLIPRPDGGVIEAWVARSFDGEGPADAYVLGFVGNEQRAESLAEYNADRFAPRRVEAWTINHPGYGGTTAPARLRSIGPNALNAYDAIAKAADGRPIVLTSNSLGGTAAMYVASRQPVAGLIVQNPPALREVIRSQGWWNLWLIALPASLRVPDELDAPAHAKLVRSPAIFITADADNRVMPKFQQLTIDAFAGPKRMLHLVRKGHDDTIDSPEEWREFRGDLDWLFASVTPR